MDIETAERTVAETKRRYLAERYRYDRSRSAAERHDRYWSLTEAEDAYRQAKERLSEIRRTAEGDDD